LCSALLYDTNSSNAVTDAMFYTPVGLNLAAYALQPFGNPFPTTITGAGTLPWQFSIFATLSRGGTLGLTALGTNHDDTEANYLTGSPVTVGSQAVTVASMSTYVGAVDAAPNNQFAFAIYTDNGGVPGTLVAQSQVGTLTAGQFTGAAWIPSVRSRSSRSSSGSFAGRSNLLMNVRIGRRCRFETSNSFRV